jgi:DNA-binding PadR family transcriptional regulator
MKHSRTAYVILGSLSIEKNLSGYEIHKGIEENFGSFWGESYGQIYPALKQLVADGLIEIANPASAAKKSRQEYSLTDAGRASLREWLALPFQNDPPRNEFMLKLFFGYEAEPGVSIAHVRELQARNRRSLVMLEGIEKMAQAHQSTNPHLPYWMLTLSLGIAMTRAAIAWGESALVQLAAMEGPAAVNPSPADGTADAAVFPEPGR